MVRTPTGWEELKGPTGDTGATGPTGPGMPPDPAMGQVLMKRSLGDHDVHWGSLYTSVQRDWGRENAYVPAVNGGLVVVQPSGRLLEIARTPPVDEFWEVTAVVGIVQKMDAAYSYAVFGPHLNQADQDNVQSGWHYVQQHSAVQQFKYRTATRTFRLRAGVAYVCNVYSILAAGSWTYHSGPDYLSLEGKTWPQ
jgi:hypothetical protein